MYLDKRTYVKNWNHTKEEKHFDVSVKRGGEPYAPIKRDRIKQVVEEVCYWRKANQIHAWFVQNVQDGEDDCRDYWVSVEQLEKLLEDCKAALAAPDPSKIMPTCPGFFFGSVEYDDFYRQDLEETVEMLEALLEEDNSDADFYYRASW
ncbi:hypothetical protein LJC19_04935 [Oxalobacter sp. OttesenSCG-928-P03]|nr:hypothetical protein [Oxalobacter sp. OttesenSCG-928-P03]